jgi:hypothetical protein
LEVLGGIPFGLFKESYLFERLIGPYKLVKVSKYLELSTMKLVESHHILAKNIVSCKSMDT